jgi:HAD superfamily hydrolase (TIGR01509 family)
LLEFWQEIYREHGIALSTLDWISLLAALSDPPSAYERLEHHLGIKLDRESPDKKRHVREVELLAEKCTMPSILEVLKAARSKSMQMAIASNPGQEWVEEHLINLKLDNFFNCVLCTEDFEQKKPAPDIYLAVLERLAIHPEEAVVFEDSYIGVTAAKLVGLFCVQMPNLVTKPTINSETDLVVSSLDERTLDEYIQAATQG